MRLAMTVALALSMLTAATLHAQQKKARPKEERRSGGAGATHADVHYGPNDRQVMDVWLAKSDKPTPVLVSIHGGGFRGGTKSVDPGLREACVKAGISVVAITYRLSGTDKAPAQFEDCARAIQFIRSKAGEWNLDTKRFASTGGSAGAGLSLWLAFHPDMADPNSSDPVARQSTRLTCASVFNGQTSYDPRTIRDLFPGANTYQHEALSQLFDVKLDNLDALPPEKLKLFEQVSPINFLTKDDPPVQLSYGFTMDHKADIHHPQFGMMLKQKMDPLHIECLVHTGVGKSGEDATKLIMDFVTRHFGVAKPGE